MNISCASFRDIVMMQVWGWGILRRGPRRIKEEEQQLQVNVVAIGSIIGLKGEERLVLWTDLLIGYLLTTFG